MPRTLLRKLSLLLTVVLIASTVLLTSPAAAQGPTRDFGSESGFLGSLNGQRAAAGLAPLTLNGSMTAAADGWAQQMVNGSFLAHAGDIVSGTPGGWTKVGENVGRGQTVASLTSAFMSSPGHRANILDASFTHIGIAVYNHPTDGRMYTTHRFAALGVAAPVAVPTQAPAPTAIPTLAPAPTAIPTIAPLPTPIPTLAPAPTAIPTLAPAPTAIPTIAPLPTATAIPVAPLPTTPAVPTATAVPATATPVPATPVPATAVPVQPTAVPATPAPATPAPATPVPATPVPETPATTDDAPDFGVAPEQLAFVDGSGDRNLSDNGAASVTELEAAKLASKSKKLTVVSLRNINYRG